MHTEVALAEAAAPFRRGIDFLHLRNLALLMGDV